MSTEFNTNPSNGSLPSPSAISESIKKTELDTASAKGWQSNLPAGLETQTFSTRDVLSVTTERVLTKPHDPQDETDHGISNLYKLIGYMTGNDKFYNILDHMTEDDAAACVPVLEEPANECLQCLERWYPGLKAVDGELAVLDTRLEAAEDRQLVIETWLNDTYQKLGIPAELEIAKIPKDASGPTDS